MKGEVEQDIMELLIQEICKDCKVKGCKDCLYLKAALRGDQKPIYLYLKANQLTDRQEKLLNTVKGYAYNAYEVCRLMNGHAMREFVPCFRNRRECKDRCNRKKRNCSISSRSVHGSLSSLLKKGKLLSIRLRWFDSGRSTPKGELCTDLFRIYFCSKGDLAKRLIDDIRMHLLEGADLDG